MTRHDQAAIAIGIFVFLFTLLGTWANRKNDWELEHSVGLTKVRIVPKKPSSAFRVIVQAIGAGLIFGLLIWWTD